MTTSPLDDRRDDAGTAGPSFDGSGDVRSLTDTERSERTAALLARAHAAGVGETERETCFERVVELNMRVAEAVARRYARSSIPV